MSPVPASIERTKPYVLVVGRVSDEKLQAYLDGLGSGVTYVDAPEEVRQQDYDFIIDMGASIDHWIDGNATVLRFEQGRFIGSLAQVGKQSLRANGVLLGTSRRYQVQRVEGQRAASFTMVDNPLAGVDFRSIVSDTILSNIHLAGDYTTIKVYGSTDYSVVPLLAESDGEPLAAIIDFPDLGSYWSLPSETTDQLRWVTFFLDAMRTVQPDAFPPDEVELADVWRTPAELAAKRAVSDHETETERILVERNRQLLELEQQVKEAAEEADVGDRLLLTAQGDALERGIASVLRGFGFTVEDRDEINVGNKASKKEDLRLTYPMNGNDVWVCLAEVKGYAKSAKAGDLRQVDSAANFYQFEHGHPPQARWYVVNANIKLLPDERPVPLLSNQDLVQPFAEDGGLVLDTKWLFQLKKQVDLGMMAPKDAAQELMRQRGTFILPPEGAEHAVSEQEGASSTEKEPLATNA